MNMKSNPVLSSKQWTPFWYWNTLQRLTW